LPRLDNSSADTEAARVSARADTGIASDAKSAAPPTTTASRSNFIFIIVASPSCNGQCVADRLRCRRPAQAHGRPLHEDFRRTGMALRMKPAGADTPKS
jgi:hypothetical protein